MAELLILMQRDKYAVVEFGKGGEFVKIITSHKGARVELSGYTDAVVEILRDLGVLRG